MFQAFQDKAHQPFYIQGDASVAVLLTHGFPGSPKEMYPIASVIHQHTNWTVQGILLPGFGPDIESIMNYTHIQWQQAVLSALKDLKKTHQHVILAGNSMGGALSIYAASQIDIDALILFAPFWKVDHFLWGALPFLRHVLPTFQPFRLFKPDFQDPEFQRGMENFIPNADFNDPVLQQETRKLQVHTGVFDEIRQVGQQGYEHANTVQRPTLVIQGTEDELVTPKSTQKLLAQLGEQVQYHEVSAPHNPLHEELACWPDVKKHVLSFIDTLHLPK